MNKDATPTASPPVGLKALQALAILAILAEGGTLLTAMGLYLREYPVTGVIIVGALLVLCLAALVWYLPRRAKKLRGTVIALLLLLAVLIVLPLSTLWPGGITTSRFGLTVVGVCPIPVFDITISSGGVLWFRDKSHTITVEEVTPLVESGIDQIIIGTGWNGVAKVKPEVLELQGVKIEVLKTADAFAEYNRLRREGKLVALLAHTTC